MRTELVGPTSKKRTAHLQRQRREYYKKRWNNLEYRRAHKLARYCNIYRLSAQQVEVFAAKEHCEICKEKFSFTLLGDKGARRGNRCATLDHNHATGRVRGVICHQCNRQIGYFENLLSSGKLAVLGEYLDERGAVTNNLPAPSAPGPITVTVV